MRVLLSFLDFDFMRGMPPDRLTGLRDNDPSQPFNHSVHLFPDQRGIVSTGREPLDLGAECSVFRRDLFGHRGGPEGQGGDNRVALARAEIDRLHENGRMPEEWVGVK